MKIMRKSRVSLYLENEIIEKVKELSEPTGLSISSYLRSILYKQMEQEIAEGNMGSLNERRTQDLP